MFFSQIIVFLWHVPEARVFLEKVNRLFHLVVWPSFGAFTRVFRFLPKRLMFPQIIRSTQLDTPCLQQNALRLFVFWKKYYKARAQTFSRGQHCWGSTQTGATLLRYDSPVTAGNNRNVGTCWAKRLTGFKLYATTANIVMVPYKRTQQVTTLLGPTMLGVFGQQCCVRLHGPLGLIETEANSEYKKTLPLFILTLCIKFECYIYTHLPNHTKWFGKMTRFQFCDPYLPHIIWLPCYGRVGVPAWQGKKCSR